MKPERWQEIKKVLAGALDKAPEDRRAYLDQSCPDADLRREVESLIVAHEQGRTNFLEPTDKARPLLASTKLGPMEESEHLDDLSGTSVGRFRIIEKLGGGGMGEVYLAEDPQLRRTVAIKRMAQSLVGKSKHRQRFLREAQMASQLNDSHIASIYDVLEQEGGIFLVMERVEGKTLRQFLGEPMKLDQFLPLAKQCVQGLAAAHKQGVVHRDIKPENIMVTPSGQVKILDFGLARHAADEEEKAEFQTEPGSLIGTAGYMAPEAMLEGKADARTDIFSLGVVFYEMLTGRHPFRDRTYTAISNRVLHEEPPPPSSVNPAVPADLDRIIARMLAKKPDERWSTADELAADLSWLEQSGTAPTMEVTPPPGTVKRAGQRKLRIAAAAVAAAVVAVVLVVLVIPRVRHGADSRTGAGAAAQPERQLAVLPFTVYNGTAAQQAFAAGLTDTVTAQLSELSANHALAVVPASDVFAKKVASPEAARQQFGVNLTLTGSLQEAGGQIRVTYALVDTRTKWQLDAQTKTAAAGNPFALEDDISNGVLGMLQMQLQPGERQTLEAKGTDKPDAYALYLRGMGYIENYQRPENVTNAISAFRDALKIDPHYARAEAEMGIAYWRRYNLTQDAKWTAMSRQACDRSIALDSKLAAAHNCLGTVASGTGKYADAVSQFQQALAADPTNVLAYQSLANAYANLGRTAEAEQTYQKAIRLRPQYWGAYTWLGIFYFNHGRYTDAAKMFQQVVALVPDSAPAYSNLGALYEQMGDFAKAATTLRRAIAIQPNAGAYSNLGYAEFYTHQYGNAAADFEKAVKMEPNDYQIWRNVGDSFYWARGKRKQAEAAYRKAIEMANKALQVNPKDPLAYTTLAVSDAMTGSGKQALAAMRKALELSPDDPSAFYAAAIVYTQLGQREQGMEWLKKAVATGIPPATVRNEPALDPLHDMKDFSGISQANNPS